VKLTVTDKNGDHLGSGVWGVDQPNGKAIESYKFDDGNYDVFTLSVMILAKSSRLQIPTPARIATSLASMALFPKRGVGFPFPNTLALVRV